MTSETANYETEHQSWTLLKICYISLTKTIQESLQGRNNKSKFSLFAKLLKLGNVIRLTYSTRFRVVSEGGSHADSLLRVVRRVVARDPGRVWAVKPLFWIFLCYLLDCKETILAHLYSFRHIAYCCVF